MNENIITSVTEVISGPIFALGYSLDEVEFVKEGGLYFLRVVIDKENIDIDVDDCAVVTEKISPLIDTIDLIESNYILEVCSRGVEKVLKTASEIETNIGSFVNIAIKEKVEGKKILTGTLLKFSDNILTIDTNIKGISKKIEIDYRNVKRIIKTIKW